MTRTPAHLLHLTLALLLATGGCREATPDAPDPSSRPDTSHEPTLRTSGDRAPDPDGADSRAERLDEAEALYRRARYDSARAALEALVAEAGEVGDERTRAQALMWLGFTEGRAGAMERSRRLHEEALRTKREHGLDDLVSRSYNALGLLAWDEGRLDDARGFYDQAVRSARAAGDDEGVARAVGNLGLVHEWLGRFDEARRSYETLLAAGRATGDDIWTSNALANLGGLAVRTGDPAAALEHLLEARRVHERIDHVNGLQNLFGQLGSAWAAQGEPGRALAHYDSALALTRRHGLPAEEAANLELLAGLHLEAGDLHRSLALYERAAAVNEEVGRLIEEGIDLRMIARIHARLGDLESASVRAREALEMHREAGAVLEELADLLLVAELAEMRRESGEARTALRRAREVSRGLDLPVAYRDFALAAGRVADLRGDPAAVLAALDEAPAALGGADYATEWEAETLRARAHRALGRADSAEAAARRAVRAVERVRERFGSDALRTSWASARADTYGDLVGILLSTGRVEEALEVADRARARGLVERLGATGTRSARRGASLRALEAGEDLLRRIDRLVETLRDPYSWSERDLDALEERLQATRREYEALVIRSAEDPEDRGARAAGLVALSASDIRASLEPGEALVEYLITRDEVHVFVATRREVRHARRDVLPDRLAGTVRVVRDRLGRPGDPPAEALEALHRLLVEPAMETGALGGVGRWVVVPHGVLNHVPFPALRDPDTGRYLVQDHTFVFVPSASALPGLRSGPAPRLASGALLAPFPRTLPGSVAEAEAVERTRPDVSVLRGQPASEAAARDALASRDFVHLATHGVMNPRSPLFSRVELRATDGTGPAVDGRLELHEVLGMEVVSDLVYLSGCETGLGSAWTTAFEQGEDWATLARSFLFAGATNVVATLWRVEDRSAARLAELFYRSLASRSAAEALARAQREMLAGPAEEGRSPFHWAGYRLTGGGR